MPPSFSFVHPKLEDMGISQMKKELRELYALEDTSACLEIQDLREKLRVVRETQPVTHQLNYGSILQIGNRKNPTGIVTIAHGLGDSAKGWADAAEHLAASFPHLLFVLPTAPVRRVTVNNNMPMNAWFNVVAFGLKGNFDTTGIFQSAEYIYSLANAIAAIHHLDSSRIIYCGFSQGAAISIAAGIHAPVPPAAVIALSGFTIPDVASTLVNKKVPILMCHGTSDPIIAYDKAQMSQQLLKSNGVMDVTLKTYEGMQHSSCPQEMQDVSAFIAKILPKPQ